MDKIALLGSVTQSTTKVANRLRNCRSLVFGEKERHHHRHLRHTVGGTQDRMPVSDAVYWW